MQKGGGNQVLCREGQGRLTAENSGKARLTVGTTDFQLYARHGWSCQGLETDHRGRWQQSSSNILLTVILVNETDWSKSNSER